MLVVTTLLCSVVFIFSANARTLPQARRRQTAPPIASSTLVVPILTYHHIATHTPPNAFYVSPAMFEKQMAWLSKNHYTPITYQQFYAARFGTSTLPTKPVVITFDDGSLDEFTNALPILKKYNYPAMFYIIAGDVGKTYWMSWSQMKTLLRHGMEIGSHSMTHPHLPDRNNEQKAYELKGSKALLESQLGIPINFFAYPGGAYNTSTVYALAEAGYLSAVTTDYAVEHPANESRWLVHRIHVDDDLLSFVQWMRKK